MTDNPEQKEESKRHKAEVISSVSHDLRSPLVAVRNSITLMLDKRTGDLNSEQKKILEIAQRNIKRLSLSIDRILASAKSEGKKDK